MYRMRFAGQPAGLAGEEYVLRLIHGSFSGLRITLEDLIVDENTAVVRWTMRGTQERVFRGAEPTGRPTLFTGIDILRIANGKIVERWDEVTERSPHD
jgi:predicted ester cyclase